MKKFAFIFIFITLFSATALAEDLNPKSIEYLKAKIIQSGSLEITGTVQSANMTVYIPQENIESIKTVPENFRYVYDEYENRMILFEWTNPKGRIDYRIESIIDNEADSLPFEIPIGENQEYTQETESIQITPEIAEIAYPYENNLKGVADLAVWTHRYITYDKNFAQKYKTSKEIFENKRGVCSEFATLLSALLRSKNIPTRYIVGFAYSVQDKKLIGHAWVEVYLKNKQWVPFDPTWLEGGYLDATHIKLANLPGDSQKDMMIYRGAGSITWERNEEEIQLLDYRKKTPSQINIEKNDIAFNEHGYIKATVNDNCMIEDIAAISCIDNEIPVLDIYDDQRVFWFCGSADVYWVYRPVHFDRGFVYSCPVSVFDQNGASATEKVRISGEKNVPAVSISGPETVSVGKDFTLTGNTLDNFIFFSPNLTKSQYKSWNLNLKIPGTYKFYLYHDGGLAIKDVNVVEEKKFDVTIEYPTNARANEPFAIVVNITNLLSDRSFPKATLKLDDLNIEKSLLFNPGEKLRLVYNITSNSPGMKKATLYIETDTLNMYSIYINVLEKEKGWLEAFIDAIAGFFQGIAKAITGMIGEKVVYSNFL